ncbi:uncharacterized protein BJ212DRAFT_1326335 [Suillus subaureus]|uniref:Uncharacterized protein n=1 Tax=Suillus subaureus TaxID=48587 RepID=A0A9P7JI81_9AGAM|nr:uncharacterized protein BJ212DRAFT_1326335 [Suillus subaureus]KAG1823739.1 hypothetical protein BJ212DRAFT_1326335 [Suillus subaureus]
MVCTRVHATIFDVSTNFHLHNHTSLPRPPITKKLNMFLSFNLFIILAHVILAAVARRPANRYQDLRANTIPADQQHNETLATRTSLQNKKPHRSRKTGAKQDARLRKRSRLTSKSSTPARLSRPTGPSSVSTTVHITNVTDFALLLPAKDGEFISNAESDATVYCTNGSNCQNTFPANFITGAIISEASDGSYIQITGCLDSGKFHFAQDDAGGQMDVRFPNGAKCAFGGYGASFIEQVEPSANRFCLRCCASANDQVNCNSHNDKAGCPVAVPGTYDFDGVSCS